MALKAANCPKLFDLFTTSLGTVVRCNIHVRYCETCNPKELDDSFTIGEILGVVG
jgi:hypothetical protein